MKLQIVLSFLFFIILCTAGNIYFLKIPTMQWIGIMLVSIVVLSVIGTFAGKANKKIKGIKGEPDAFIFPDGTAKKLKKMDLGIQYEASVISSALLMLGIILFLIYFIFFTTSTWMMKGLIIFNSVCGMGLMGGMLVTYYQQLVSYRESMKFLTQVANKQPPVQEEYYDEEGYVPEEEYSQSQPQSRQSNYNYTNERRNIR